MKIADSLEQLSPILQKTVALLALLVLLAVLWLILIAPFQWAMSAQSSWRHTMRHQIALERGWLDSAPRLKSLEDAIEHSAIWTQFYSPNGGDAASALRRDVGALVSAAGGGLVRTEVMPAVPDAGLTRVAVRLVITTTIDQLKTLLSSIKAHAPYLRVEQIHVSAPQSQSHDANAALTVTLDIYGCVGELDPLLKVRA